MPEFGADDAANDALAAKNDNAFERISENVNHAGYLAFGTGTGSAIGAAFGAIFGPGGIILGGIAGGILGESIAEDAYQSWGIDARLKVYRSDSNVPIEFLSFVDNGNSSVKGVGTYSWEMDGFTIKHEAGLTLSSCKLRVYGTDGEDKIVGCGRENALYGGAGDDKLYGGGGVDYLHGGTGDNYLNGGTGNDTLESVDDEGDTMRGGDGADTFRFAGRNAKAVDYQVADRAVWYEEIAHVYGDADKKVITRIVSEYENELVLDEPFAYTGSAWDEAAMLIH